MSEAVKFDPFAPETMTAGPSAYSQLAKQCPVYRYRSEFDFFIDSNYQEIKEVILKNHGTWTFRHGPGPRDVGVTNESGLVTDPPVHEPFRLVIQRAFSATKLAKLAKDIDRIADELIGKMLDDPEGEGDFYQLFAMPLPSRLMCIHARCARDELPQIQGVGRHTLFSDHEQSGGGCGKRRHA